MSKKSFQSVPKPKMLTDDALESFEKAGPGHGFRSRQDPEQAGVLAEGREGRCGHTRIVEVRSPVEQRAS